MDLRQRSGAAVEGCHRTAQEIEDIDKHDRLLAVCSIGDVELNRWMVENGWAVAYGRYRDEERMAENQRRGIWQGRFERPRDWRDRDRLDRAKTG